MRIELGTRPGKVCVAPFFFSIHDWSQVFFAQPQNQLKLIALAGVFYVYFFLGGLCWCASNIFMFIPKFGEDSVG